MVIILGLVVLIAAVVAGVVGVLSNAGAGHALGHEFAVFGYHVTGSTGTLFLYGIVVGALALFGLSLLLTAARRTSRRGRTARRALKESRRETAIVSQDRDELIEQREAERGHVADGTPTVAGAPDKDRPLDPGSTRHRRPLFGHRSPTRDSTPSAPADPDR